MCGLDLYHVGHSLSPVGAPFFILPIPPNYTMTSLAYVDFVNEKIIHCPHGAIKFLVEERNPHSGLYSDPPCCDSCCCHDAPVV